MERKAEDSHFMVLKVTANLKSLGGEARLSQIQWPSAADSINSLVIAVLNRNENNKQLSPANCAAIRDNSRSCRICWCFQLLYFQIHPRICLWCAFPQYVCNHENTLKSTFPWKHRWAKSKDGAGGDRPYPREVPKKRAGGRSKCQNSAVTQAQRSRPGAGKHDLIQSHWQ